MNDRGARLMAQAWSQSRGAHLAVQAASFILAVTLAACALRGGLLVGLLAACLGFLVTLEVSKIKGLRRLPTWPVAALVILTPLLLIAVLGLNAKGLTSVAFAQFPELMRQMANTVLEFREKLPKGLAQHVPEGTSAVQAWVADYLKSRAAGMAVVG